MQTLAASTKASISLTDAGIATLSITTAQGRADSAALTALTGNFVVVENASSLSETIAGVQGHGTVIAFAGMAADYSVSSSGSDITVSAGGIGVTDHLSNIDALRFVDQTEIIAQAPSVSGTPTTGNITELYGAVFGREPDVAGLAYYQAELAANPALPMTVFAQWFLASPEYTGNVSHNYAQTNAGDAQFVADTYGNLLHRAPETGAVVYYQAIINQFTQGLAPGSAAFTDAETKGHAVVLVDFSASSEFLADVQVTAQHPADAQHWLVLI